MTQPEDSLIAMTKVGRPAVDKPKPGSVRERVAAAKAINGGTDSPVIQLLLDCSGSMDNMDNSDQTKIVLLRAAIKSFINEIDLTKYRVGMESFPLGLTHCPPTNSYTVLNMSSDNPRATGETPMGSAIAKVLSTLPLPERAIIISDGDATDDAFAALTSVKESPDPDAQDSATKAVQKRTLPIFDCVHVGSSKSGEATLKEVARLTGGIYIKFTDLKAFEKNFKYLAPQYRALLMSEDAAKLTGAKEVR